MDSRSRKPKSLRMRSFIGLLKITNKGATASSNWGIDDSFKGSKIVRININVKEHWRQAQEARKFAQL